MKVSLRSQSVESTKLKVNDKLGNPIEIAAVILYEVSDTYKAVFDVTNFNEYMKTKARQLFVTLQQVTLMIILKMYMRK